MAHVNQQLKFCLVLKELTPRRVFLFVTATVILVADFVISTAPTPVGHESWRILQISSWSQVVLVVSCLRAEQQSERPSMVLELEVHSGHNQWEKPL